MTIDEMLKDERITIEKNVYGFLVILFLFSDLNDMKPIEVINMQKDKYEMYIITGWGDVSQWFNIVMSDWTNDILEKSFDGSVKNEEFYRARDKAIKAWEEIYNKTKPGQKYSETIKEYFEDSSNEI